MLTSAAFGPQISPKSNPKVHQQLCSLASSIRTLWPKPRYDDALRHRLEHDPEKWKPVFRKDHAQTKG
jgi:hypothetical protein